MHYYCKADSLAALAAAVNSLLDKLHRAYPEEMSYLENIADDELDWLVARQFKGLSPRERICIVGMQIVGALLLKAKNIFGSNS